MAGVYFEKETLVSLIEHHIGIVNRYGFDKEERFSIICFEAKDLLTSAITNAMQKILRESDAIINNGEIYYLLLPMTKKEGAKILMDNIEEYIGKKIRSAIFSYPEDGTSLKELIIKVESFGGK